MRGNDEGLSLPDPDAAVIGIANPCRLFGNQVEDRLKVAGRAVDDLQNLRRRRLLIEDLALFRFSPLGVGDVEIGEQPPAVGQDKTLIQ